MGNEMAPLPDSICERLKHFPNFFWWPHLTTLTLSPAIGLKIRTKALSCQTPAVFMENLIIQFLLSSSLLVDGSCPGPRSWPSPQHCQGPTAHWVGVEWEPGWEVEWEFSSTLPATHWVGVEWEQVATDLLNTRLPLTHSPTPNPEIKEFNRGGGKKL